LNELGQDPGLGAIGQLQGFGLRSVRQGQSHELVIGRELALEEALAALRAGHDFAPELFDDADRLPEGAAGGLGFAELPVGLAGEGFGLPMVLGVLVAAREIRRPLG
jgi:hypothetical protein